jgi:hypothetical protein
MMQGIVDQNCEATIRLVVGNADSQRQMIDAVIDTGFTGFLTLPFSVLADLNIFSGLQLGFIWENENLSVILAGNLARFEARAVVVESLVNSLLKRVNLSLNSCQNSFWGISNSFARHFARILSIDKHKCVKI